MSVGEALMSPTRQWAIIIKELIADLVQKNLFHMLHGITMNTGGGATKISNIGSGVIYKKRMPIPAPIFQLIKQESGETWKNMYKSFNCGIGLDIVGENDPAFINSIKESVKACKIKMSLLGSVSQGIDLTDNKVIIVTPYGKFEY
jgi:phosphoribosylaminoimidazole (AIR) synthetase